MENKYDVIVIGSGIGGLTAAALLVKQGLKVLVLEKNPESGGYATSYKRKNFIFEASLHLINGYKEESITMEILKECGIKNKIEFQIPEYLYRSIYPDFDLRVEQFKPLGFLESLVREFPREEKGISKVFKVMDSIHDDAYRMLKKEGFPSGLQLLNFPFKYPALFYYSNKSSANLLNTYIEDHRLKTVISQLWLYYGLSPKNLSAFYFSYPWHDYYYNGGFYIKGGSRKLSNMLVDSIKENGGKIILNCRVEQIITKNKKVVEIITEKGNFNSKFLISNIDANATFNKLVGYDKLPHRFIKRMKNLQSSLSIFAVNIGLNTDIKTLNKIDYEIFINPDYDINSQFKASQDNRLIDSALVVTLYSNLEKMSIYNSNKSVISIVTLSGYDFWKKFNENDYKDKKNELANILIKRVEQYLPNLSKFIEVVDIATPLTMERFTGNYKGSVYGFSQIISQSGVNRLHNVTPIDNLYLSSAWTFPGGGFGGVMIAAKLVTKEILKNYCKHN